MLLPVPGWAGACEEPLDPSEGEMLWECACRRVLLPGKVNLGMSCHGHRLAVETGPRQTLGQMESRA